MSKILGQLYHIPHHLDLLRHLADYLLKNPQSLVILPTRRAVLRLTDLLKENIGQSLLMPNIFCPQDIDDFLALTPQIFQGVPPALSAQTRQILLTRLVAGMAEYESFSAGLPKLVESLGSFLDEWYNEDLPLTQMMDAIPMELASHWQQTANLLRIISEYWPQIAEEEGGMDVILRRNILLKNLISHWQQHPPLSPIMMAGFTGSQPTMAALMTQITRMEKGVVLLQGLWVEASTEIWQEINPQHPQYAFKKFLEANQLLPAQIEPWPALPASSTATSSTANIRQLLWQEVMLPASKTPQWSKLSDSIPQQQLASDITDIHAITCQHGQEEAMVAALILREALEKPQQTAALVTLDRGLAVTVSHLLLRWGIKVNDSAGLALEQTPVGIFLHLLAGVSSKRCDALSLMPLLKHPLCRAGLSAANAREAGRQLDLAFRRLALHGLSWADVIDALQQEEQKGKLASDSMALLLAIKQGMEQLENARNQNLSDLLEAHIAWAEILTRHENGDILLWSNDDGATAKEWVATLLQHADFSVPNGVSYRDFFASLMQGVSLRPQFGLHPRLFIWGPVEARLQQADIMVISGLNEGQWPDTKEDDCWFPLPARKAAGLTSAAFKAGMLAHDFIGLANSKKLYLTKAEKMGGAPQIASRWWQRLEAVLAAAKLALPAPPLDFLQLARTIDRPLAQRPVAMPAPTPPLAARPRRFSVSDIGLWRKDPYAFYARKILQLKALLPLQPEPGAADRGALFHAGIHAYISQNPDRFDLEAKEKFLELAHPVFNSNKLDREARSFWWPRFEHMAEWFINEEKSRFADHVTKVLGEVVGELIWQSPEGTTTLVCRADRLEEHYGGGYSIIDYKTGTPPSAKEVQLGFAPQLPLEAAILHYGGMADIAANNNQSLQGLALHRLEYWQLSGTDGGKVHEIRLNTQELAEQALASVKELVAWFDTLDSAYIPSPWPEFAPRGEAEREYRMLSRRDEWEISNV
ncbi:MAG: double-strand break repair protein AddB [Alphaproteobacteria bacterium]